MMLQTSVYQMKTSLFCSNFYSYLADNFFENIDYMYLI